MKLSSKARYGLKAMCYMADRHGEGVISLSTMSSSIGVSEKYLEQLISTLRKAGLISANRGANGGYFLSKSPDDISSATANAVVQPIRATATANVIARPTTYGINCTRLSTTVWTQCHCRVL